MKAWLVKWADDIAFVVTFLIVVAVIRETERRAYALGVQAEADRLASEALGG